jgi:phosphoglycerate dehydrogenase-like enzyme
VTVLLISNRLHALRGAALRAHVQRTGTDLDLVVLPAGNTERLPGPECGRIEAAFFSPDVFPEYSRQFFSAVRQAPRLQWLHVFNAGVDHPVYTEMLERGVRVTTSSGAAAVPVAQTAIGGLLWLARPFPQWHAAQRRHAWEPLQAAQAPRDLHEQTIVIAGLGHIGNEIARLAKALGMQVIGVRRSGRRQPGDCADEVCSAETLNEVLPRCDWLAIACPLTPQTRGMIGAERLALMPRGARIINVARGEIVDEAALVGALQSGHLAGAYLDVFRQEPLAHDSPLWEMRNVLVTPHNSSAAAGNEQRIFEMFLDNRDRGQRAGRLRNEVGSGRQRREA